MTAGYDVAVVGAGIVGLAHALAARRRGKSVIVLERDAQPFGASIRNFGFVTVSGQQAGACWHHARRARDIWAEVAEAAGIEVLQRGLVVAARRPEAEAVVDAFLATDMGTECRRLTRAEALEMNPALTPSGVTAALYSPHELRVESRTALPALIAWLRDGLGVDFRFGCAVSRVAAPEVETSLGVIHAETVIVCPGDDGTTLFADRIAARGVSRCKLHMLRLRPGASLPLTTPVMSDLGLARYHGYADLPEAAALKARLDREQPAQRANGVHLICVQSADGSLVVGDSHHYGDEVTPFQPAHVDRLILDEFDAVLACPNYRIEERWLGTYAVSPQGWTFTDAPDDATRIVMVTAGCGASTAFSIGEQTLAELYGTKAA
ncbi:TIGR03364 family FAD-dependent oxidoreductase [Pyruvatibacter mobilis]|uniref:TIGR03364 family FAD-dependent oxidoreductase n=1 Tax=Pyruvatibacter mobilis TaxID=1712261 RepID=UPI003BAA1DE4